MAVLQFLEKHPVLKIEHRTVTIEISHLDDFKLEVKEQLYELDENDEDLSHEE